MSSMRHDKEARPLGPLAATSRMNEIEAMLSALTSVVPDRGGTYLSAPITTGRRFLGWFERHRKLPREGGPETERAFDLEVVEPNRAEARIAASKLRASQREPVIDPTAVLHIRDWGQGDYRAFWAAVIERLASKVVFLDGWEFSSGCSVEFLVAMEHALPALTPSGSPISKADGIRALEAALRDWPPPAFPTELIGGVLDRLKAPR